MSTDNDSAEKYDGSIDADLRAAPTFTRASKLPRGSSETGSLESRLESAIKQLSECARQSEDEWLVEALAAVVADLERLWAAAAGIEFSGGESAFSSCVQFPAFTFGPVPMAFKL